MNNEATILATHTPALFQAAVRAAVELLREGELVALPTETVYGLAANAWNAQAVQKIFQAKGRPGHNPIIVHVAGLELARRCVAHWPKPAEQMAGAFWPGPVTLVLPRSELIPEVVTAGGGTVGVRWPSHPFIQAVIRECGFPLAAPSANPSAGISPTTARHVAKSLGQRIALIVDGGPSQVGIESTVLDLSGASPVVLRPGVIHEESLEAVLGRRFKTPTVGASERQSERLRSPGLLLKHYAPQAKMWVQSWEKESDLVRFICQQGEETGRAHVIAHTHIPSSSQWGRVSVIPHDALAFARAIYAELHRCDEEGARLIVVEAVPAGPEWKAIRDRLERASCPG